VAKSSRSERPGSPRARLFLALELPDETRAELVSWRSSALAGRDDLRPVAPEALHATLVFLGYQYEKEIARIGSVAFEAVRDLRAPGLSPAGVVPVPPKRDPRLFALDLDDPDGDCGAVQRAASDALAAGRFYKPEKRPFWPHVTLARVKRGVRRAPPLEGSPELAPFTASVVTLYRSVLRPQGALYEPLDRVSLGAG
jgi:2'-5' RNA ligase